MSKESEGYFVTGRPFELDKSHLSPQNISQIKERYGSYDHGKYALGFTPEEITDLIENHDEVLEVGPGYGNSFKQLDDLGINVWGAEPALKNEYYQAELEKAYGDQITKVKPIRAKDVPKEYGENLFKVILAIGPNFQNYSTSEEELTNNILQLMKSLKKDF